MAKNKFDFFEIVKIISKRQSLKNYYGCRAVVTGMVEREDYPFKFAYSVGVLDKSNDIDFNLSIDEEDDLESMGEKMERSKIYTGESIRVRVNPETGEGELVEDSTAESTDDATENEVKLKSLQKPSLENWWNGITDPPSYPHTSATRPVSEKSGKEAKGTRRKSVSKETTSRAEEEDKS